MLFTYVEIKKFATDDQFTVGALGVVILQRTAIIWKLLVIHVQ